MNSGIVGLEFLYNYVLSGVVGLSVVSRQKCHLVYKRQEGDMDREGGRDGKELIFCMFDDKMSCGSGK